MRKAGRHGAGGWKYHGRTSKSRRPVSPQQGGAFQFLAEEQKRLLAEGRMAPAGLAMVELAQQMGPGTP
ncbi:MAG: hypothetical protein IPK21_24555 [Haliscomenobacter sp.]|nr:hypothetical protein [Haliscomenobacter sp.]